MIYQVLYIPGGAGFLPSTVYPHFLFFLVEFHPNVNELAPGSQNNGGFGKEILRKLVSNSSSIFCYLNCSLPNGESQHVGRAC